MKKVLMLAAVAAMALAGPAVAQDKKQLVIVVKGLDNAFFEAINQGCQKWNGENTDSEYECFYTGPASTSDEAGEAQIVADMLAKPTTAAIAISPSNAPLIAQTIRNSNPTIPVMTLDADLANGRRRSAQDLSRHRQLPDGSSVSATTSRRPLRMAVSVCTIMGNPAADNIARRAQGFRDAITGQKGLAALAGEGGWTEAPGCPVFTNDDGVKGVQAMTDILAANPDLKAFGIMGGWPLFMAPQPYRDLFRPLADKIASNELRHRRCRHDRRRSRDRRRRPRDRARWSASVRDGLPCSVDDDLAHQGRRTFRIRSSPASTNAPRTRSTPASRSNLQLADLTWRGALRRAPFVCGALEETWMQLLVTGVTGKVGQALPQPLPRRAALERRADRGALQQPDDPRDRPRRRSSAARSTIPRSSPARWPARRMCCTWRR